MINIFNFRFTHDQLSAPDKKRRSAYEPGVKFVRDHFHKERVMSKSALLVGLVCVCAVAALGQNKISNQWNCAKATVEHSLPVGDQPNHAYMINQFKCTAAKGEMAGVKDKEGSGTEF